MTGLKDHNHPAFFKAAKALRKKGFSVVNPPELDKRSPQRTWEECLRRDIREMMSCSGVATLNGWKNSRGAKLEVYIAKALNWPVHSVKYWVKRRK